MPAPGFRPRASEPSIVGYRLQATGFGYFFFPEARSLKPRARQLHPVFVRVAERRSAAQGGQDAIGLEASADEVSIESLEDLAIGDRGAAAETFLERSLQQLVRVDIGRHAIEDLPREVGREARFLEATARAQTAVPARDKLVVSDRSSGPFVVKRPLAQKASDRGVDGVRRVAASVQPVPELEFGQFAPGQEGQACDIGGPSTIVQTW